MVTNATARLVRDELRGFARSKVMLVLWVILPAIAVLGYLLFRGEAGLAMTSGRSISASVFMSFVLSSLSGTLAALLVAVDIVSERQRKVFELYVIRPIPRASIIWAKFIAVFLVVTVACVLAMGIGIAVDTIGGEPFSRTVAWQALEGLAQMVSVVGLSTASGVLCGVLARSILVAVLIVLYAGQNLTLVPMLPSYFGVLPEGFWVFQAVSLILTVAIGWLATIAFRRSQF